MENKKKMDRLYAIIDEAAESRYHDLLLSLGEVQGRGGNFNCWNAAAHSDGEDGHPSLSVNNATGQWKCHACGVAGNFNTYYKKYVVGTPADKWEGSYTKFMCDVLDLKAYLPDDTKDEKLIRQSVEMTSHFNDIVNKKQTKPSQEPKKEVPTIPHEENDKYVDALLADTRVMKYLLDVRAITEDVIRKYRIGLSVEKQAMTFPMIDSKGQILNIKLYRPWNPDRKWEAKVAGLSNSFIPTPVSHLTHSKLYIFEGEPDVYCAAAHGLFGITCGSASNKSFKKFYGDQFESLFRNKEIVFVMDADDAGIATSSTMAKELYGVAKQIKIINLNKSDINPHGLDPEATKEANGKKKRSEKDFSEFMLKNGMGEKAKKVFLDLERNTIVYSQNTSRSKLEKFKVSLAESIHSKYYNKDSLKHLEIRASIRELDERVYKFPTRVCVSCKPLFDMNFKSTCCKKCAMALTPGFGDQTVKDISITMVRASDPESRNLKKNEISIRESDILSLIQTTDEKVYKAKKRIFDIPTTCSDVEFVDEEIQSIQVVDLVPDPDDMLEMPVDQSRRDQSCKKDFTVPAYFLGEKIATSEKIDVDKSYKLSAVQCMIPGDQNVSLFCYDVEPMEETLDSFQMDDDTYEMLTIFQPKDGDIKKHLDDRYSVFSGAAGINGRDDLFFLADLAYFSTVELKNDQVLPSVKRGWVEVLIAGDPRCGKSIVGEFLYNHYRIGGFIGGSTGIGRTGLIGGVVTSHGTRKIQWGKFPQNDRGIVIVDEMSRMDHDALTDLTDLRSSGYAQIEKITSGQVSAKVRKIFFSNWRGWREEDIDRSAYGIENIRKLCFEDPILARFDAATVVSAGDVSKFDCKYERISSRFTSLQCRTLLNWVYSRKPDQIKFESGFAEALNQAQEELLKSYHSSTQLINQEMRAKICRMATSLASMTFSTDPDNWDMVYVKLDHIKYITNFLNHLYSHRNMGMLDFSAEKRRSENLGDMRFMMNILKYISTDAVLYFKEGSERDICQIFSDYLLKVGRSELVIVDGNSDDIKTSGWNAMQVNDKFIGLLRTRNCIVKTSFGKFRKTEAFTMWLKDRKVKGDSAETSNILESATIEPNFKERFVPADFISNHKNNKSGKAA